ncbi:DUF1802 family protein [Nakamurella sp. YIM 132087]|uniref:DUF1802 family protein n=1 Tax=Nakamurella alba TaxID=2665158 RepID=A0A7K1FP05_9ACTN|nr:DUF1802 family protein [Nakamurella alba]MTD15892.1 DUF1802 family protein [Nakamurella alba]
MTPALKEWSAAVHALLAGRQSVLLRKGGIHEKRFTVPDVVTAGSDGAGALPFLLFPTVSHAHAERVRPEHQDLLALSAPDAGEDAVVLRALASVVAAVEVHRPEQLDSLLPLHIWTAESVRADRLDFRPRHRLSVLVVEVRPVEPVVVPRLPEFAGCRSWLDLPDTAAAAIGDPVLDRPALDLLAQEVRDRVG